MRTVEWVDYRETGKEVKRSSRILDRMHCLINSGQFRRPDTGLCHGRLNALFLDILSTTLNIFFTLFLPLPVLLARARRSQLLCRS